MHPLIQHTIDHSINGLICIDVWEERPFGEKFPDPHLAWLEDLAHLLKQKKWDSIVNASYHSKIDYNDKSIYNTLLNYNWHNYDEQIMMELIKSCNNFLVSRSIMEMFDDAAFALYSKESFLKHQKNMVPHVSRWLVVGSAWKKCVYTEDIGLINLLSLAQQNGLEFYGSPLGFIKRSDEIDPTNENTWIVTQDDFLNDEKIKWAQVEDNLFKAEGFH